MYQKIRRIKEIYRCVKAELPWNLPKMLCKHLVAYAVARINIRRTTALSQNCSPAYLFTGAKVNHKKQLTLAFGDYCEVYDKMDNTSRSRSIPCLALFPCNNLSGSWVFLNLRTNLRVRCSNWKKMVTTQAIIDLVNTLSPNPMEEQQQIQPVNQLSEQETTEAPESFTQDQTDEAAPEISPTNNDQPIELWRSQRITKGIFHRIN